MTPDPIVDEIRMLREEYAARFNHDIDAICEDARRKQQSSEREVVSREPKLVHKSQTNQPAA